MNASKRLKADKLFLSLQEIMPCRKCNCTECEECRWVVFARGKYTPYWDFHNQGIGSTKGEEQKEGKV